LKSGRSHAAAALVRGQRYADALPLLVEACAASPSEWTCWLDLASCLVAVRNHAGLFHLIGQRQEMSGDGLRLFHDCLTATLRWSDREPFQQLLAATPRDSLAFIIALYVSGIAACGDDPERGIHELKAAAAAAQGCAEHFEKDPVLCSALHEGDVLESFETIAALEQKDRTGTIDAFGHIEHDARFVGQPSSPIEAPFIFLSSCDERYLDRFGSVVTKALDDTKTRTVYHLHVVDPSDEIEHKFARLRAACANLDLQLSTETYRRDQKGYSRASYYACSRLARLPEILARYDRDVMMWDMDIEKVSNMDRLVNAMRGFDLGYFEMKHQRPSLICHLATVYFSKTGARRCADLISKYALTKLKNTPYWLLDQASVFCVSRYLQAEGALRINDFSACPGGAFETYVGVAASASEKQTLRQHAGRGAQSASRAELEKATN
jgi:hypothetical protein